MNQQINKCFLHFTVFQVLTHPCSRVAHAFRRRIPYSFEDDTLKVIFHNGVRAAEVTLENYKKFFYAQTRGYSDINLNTSSIQERLKIKQELNCKDFLWFMQQVIPEMPLPPENALYYEKIRMKNKREKCLTKENNTLIISGCVPLEPRQTFFIDVDGQFVHLQSSLCIKFEKMNVVFQKCDTAGHKWAYDSIIKQVSDKNYELCLEAVHTLLQVRKCEMSNINQKWDFQYHFDWKKKLSYL